MWWLLLLTATLVAPPEWAALAVAPVEAATTPGEDQDDGKELTKEWSVAGAALRRLPRPTSTLVRRVAPVHDHVGGAVPVCFVRTSCPIGAGVRLRC